ADAQAGLAQVAQAGDAERVALAHCDDELVAADRGSRFEEVLYLLHEAWVACKIEIGPLTGLDLADKDAATVVHPRDPGPLAFLELGDRLLDGRAQHGTGVDDQLRPARRFLLDQVGVPISLEVACAFVLAAQETDETQGRVRLGAALRQGDLD